MEVLELGCALGHLTTKLAEVSGNVTALDRSQVMISCAKQENSSENASYICTEFLDYSHDTPFDMVVSGMAMHLVEDFEALCRMVHTSLRDGGTFIFSQRHPIRTCNPVGERGQGASPTSWLVSDYFSVGERHYTWLNSNVICYHRPIGNIISTLTNIGFQIVEIVEPRPTIDHKSSRITEHSNVPSLLLLHCKK